MTVPAGRSSVLSNQKGCANCSRYSKSQTSGAISPLGSTATILADASGLIFSGNTPAILAACSSLSSPVTAIESFGVTNGAHRRGAGGLLGQRAGVVAAARARVDPFDEHLDLRFGETLLVAQIAEAFDRAPRRHASRKHGALDRFGRSASLRVFHEGERGAVLAVTRDAMRVHDPRNLPVPSDLAHHRMRQRRSADQH